MNLSCSALARLDELGGGVDKRALTCVDVRSEFVDPGRSSGLGG